MLVKKIVTYTQKAFFSILCNAVIKLILSITGISILIPKHAVYFYSQFDN